MSPLPLLSNLKNLLSPASEILTDASDASFKVHLERWTDIEKQTPAAIILPSSEEDIQKTVKWTVETSTPFVVKSGGHSQWSTIGNEGIIIDLSRYSGISVDVDSESATLMGSILQKEVATHLAEAGVFTGIQLLYKKSSMTTKHNAADYQCLALGNGNTVGAIPYFLNGGIPTSWSITGFGSDNIISARIITAEGNLVTVNPTKHPDLLWAIRGAGQHFGLVTQLVARTYPLALLGNSEGSIWMGTFIFPTTRAAEVGTAMEIIVNDSRYDTSGLMMLAAPPPSEKPVILIAARCTGDSNAGPQAYKTLHDLGPLVENSGLVPIQNVSDGRAALAAKGEYKEFGIAGVPSLKTSSFIEVAALFEEMVKECPETSKSTFNFQWGSRPVKMPEFGSAMRHHGVRFWQSVGLDLTIRNPLFLAPAVKVLADVRKGETWLLLDHQGLQKVWSTTVRSSRPGIFPTTELRTSSPTLLASIGLSCPRIPYTHLLTPTHHPTNSLFLGTTSSTPLPQNPTP